MKTTIFVQTEFGDAQFSSDTLGGRQATQEQVAQDQIKYQKAAVYTGNAVTHWRRLAHFL